MGFIGHYSFVDDVSICYVPLKSIYETQQGAFYHCSVILEPHRLYGGEIFGGGAFYSLSLIPEATQHDAEQVCLDSDGVPW
jgi:hypothetical protein